MSKMTTNANQGLSDVFDVTPVSDKKELIAVEPVEPTTDEGDLTLKLSAETAEGLIEKSADILDTASLIAAGNEDPRMYAAIASLISSMNQTNDHLLKVYDRREKKKAIKAGNPVAADEPGSTTINNPGAVFIGSTAEFSSHLKKLAGSSKV